MRFNTCSPLLNKGFCQNPYRLGQLILFIVSVGIFSASCYFQFIKGLEPCPLCLMQRFCVLLLAISSLLGSIWYRGFKGKLMFFFGLFFSLSGLYFSGRQIWLQFLPPDQLPACLPGLEILLQYFPWRDIVHAFFFGAADCGEITWQWLGLSMPAWAALYFLFFFLTSAWLYFFYHRKPS